jgi:cyclophilin family peptidyl-prolyl cis-trans isomerase
MIRLETSKGDIVLELDAEKAPKTVENFLAYVKEGFYDGTVFHRVIDGFMIQGGGFDETMTQKPTRDPIQNEANNGLKNEAYTVAMARTKDPHSATAQFFINVKDNAFLNHTAHERARMGVCRLWPRCGGKRCGRCHQDRGHRQRRIFSGRSPGAGGDPQGVGDRVGFRSAALQTALFSSRRGPFS